MMKDLFTEKISLWLDNELSPDEVVELRTHLTTCPTCRQTYQAMQQVDTLLRTAAVMMAAPVPGFTHRFETRLARRQAVKPWQVWLAVAALLGGTLVVFGAAAVVGGLSLLNLSNSMLDTGMFLQWLTSFIDSVASLRVLLNLGILFLKAGYLTVQEPLFWGCVLIAIMMTILWIRVLQTVSRRTLSTTEFVF